MRRPGVPDGSRKSGITPSLISSCPDGGIGGRCAHANGRPYITAIALANLSFMSSSLANGWGATRQMYQFVVGIACASG